MPEFNRCDEDEIVTAAELIRRCMAAPACGRTAAGSFSKYDYIKSKVNRQ
jgi:hypothetical protein